MGLREERDSEEESDSLSAGEEGLTGFQSELAGRLGTNRKNLEQSVDTVERMWDSDEEPKKEKKDKKKKKKKKGRERTASKVSAGSATKRSSG